MKTTLKLTISALCLSLGLLLPFLTGNIPHIGSMLLPMHLPVLMCGFICGWSYGLLVGFITPLLRTLLFSMPPMPYAVPMALELATYGLVTGFLYVRLHKIKYSSYITLLIAAVLGRIVWGLSTWIMYQVVSTITWPFTWKLFISGALLDAIPGIIIQFVCIPILVMTLKKSGVIKFNA